ncbi:MAG: right-handed parallel beta-helix repeat-containing protein [Planctomycetota bacterium]
MLAAAFVAAGPARAEITLYVDAAAPGPANGGNWCEAYTDFLTALREARDNLVLVAEIRVAEGIYTPTSPGGMRSTSFFLPARDVAIYGGFAGCGANDPDERDLSAYPTILSGDLNGDDHVPCTTDPECASVPGACYEGFCIGENSYHVVFAGYTTSTTILDGFIIERGTANGSGNAADRGGGIFVYHGAADPTIRNCIIRRNTALEKGGGMYNYEMTGTLSNCVFTGNTAPNGGAMFNTASALELINCTFSQNTATLNVGGIYLASPDALVVTNCILWGNSDIGGMDESAQLSLAGRPVQTNYNCIQGWTGLHPGIGNFGYDPLFVDADGADDVAGTSDDDVRLQTGSRSIGTGDPTYIPAPDEIDLEGNLRLQGCRVDRGAYEARTEQVPGDFDGNGRVDLADLAGFQLCMGPSVANPDWLDTCLCLFDADESEDIDLYDFATLQAAFMGTAP